jgi:ribosomal protein S12 methylthiotransferase accessory factor YcaO
VEDKLLKQAGKESEKGAPKEKKTCKSRKGKGKATAKDEEEWDEMGADEGMGDDEVESQGSEERSKPVAESVSKKKRGRPPGVKSKKKNQGGAEEGEANNGKVADAGVGDNDAILLALDQAHPPGVRIVFPPLLFPSTDSAHPPFSC